MVAEANFMEEHLAAGDRITVLGCDASLQACDANPWKALPHCLACCGLRESVISMLSAPAGRLPLISPAHAASPKPSDFPAFASVQELREFHWNGIHAGKEVISSLITATGSSHPDMAKHAEDIRCLLRDYVAVYLTALDYLGQHRFDRVYIFNGRFVTPRAWIRACEKAGVAYVTQERLGNPDRVLRVENNAIHNTSLYADRIKAFWETAKSDPDILAEGREFFEERPRGRVTGWDSFVANQDRDKLPEGWDPANRNVAVFSSTESEFMGLPEFFLRGVFPLQQDAYREIISETFRRDPSIRFYLRVHPNSKGEVHRWWEDPGWGELSNLTIVPPESTVSSYLMLRECEKSLVWMTTIGVEATYWGKPSIILGQAVYRGIGAAYEPGSVAEAVDLVLDKSLPPLPRDSAIAHGAYVRRGVPKLPLSEPLSSSKLLFKGKQPNAHQDILRSLWNWENVVSKSRLPVPLKRLWERWEWVRLRNRLTVR